MDALEKPRSRSRWVLIVAALVVGVLIGYWVGLQKDIGIAGNLSTNPCTGIGIKNITVSSRGAPSCVNVEDWPANGGKVVWTAPAGSTLQIVLKDPSAFPNLYCGENSCDSRLPATSAYSTTQDYAVQLYLRGTPLPLPGTPTPVPGPQNLGHIIIKP